MFDNIMLETQGCSFFWLTENHSKKWPKSRNVLEKIAKISEESQQKKLKNN